MTILCRLCNYAIHSAKPDSKAIEDVLETLMKHVGLRHHEHAVTLAILQRNFIGLVGSFLAFGYASIPPSEPSLLASYHQTKQDIENILKSEPEFGQVAAAAPASEKLN